MSRFIEPNGQLWPNACIVYGSKALFAMLRQFLEVRPP